MCGFCCCPLLFRSQISSNILAVHSKKNDYRYFFDKEVNDTEAAALSYASTCICPAYFTQTACTGNDRSNTWVDSEPYLKPPEILIPAKMRFTRIGKRGQFYKGNLHYRNSLSLSFQFTLRERTMFRLKNSLHYARFLLYHYTTSYIVSRYPAARRNRQSGQAPAQKKSLNSNPIHQPDVPYSLL